MSLLTPEEFFAQLESGGISLPSATTKTQKELNAERRARSRERYNELLQRFTNPESLPIGEIDLLIVSKNNFCFPQYWQHVNRTGYLVFLDNCPPPGPETFPFYYITQDFNSFTHKDAVRPNEKCRAFIVFPKSCYSRIHNFESKNYFLGNSSSFFREYIIDEPFHYGFYEYLVELFSPTGGLVAFPNAHSLMGPIAAEKCHRRVIGSLAHDREEKNTKHFLSLIEDGALWIK